MAENWMCQSAKGSFYLGIILSPFDLAFASRTLGSQFILLRGGIFKLGLRWGISMLLVCET